MITQCRGFGQEKQDEIGNHKPNTGDSRRGTEDDEDPQRGSEEEEETRSSFLHRCCSLVSRPITIEVRIADSRVRARTCFRVFNVIINLCNANVIIDIFIILLFFIKLLI